MMSSQHQYLLQQEQQRREETERQLYYTSASMEDMRRQLIDLQHAYQQQSVMLEHERQQRAALVEQLKQQQAMLAEKERHQRVTSEQQQLIQRVSAEVRRFQAANSDYQNSGGAGNNNNNNNAAAAVTAATADEGFFGEECSLFSREMAIVPSEIPAPAKYPHVDWSPDYSMARLEDMMESPESSRNTLFYALLGFHVKRLEALSFDNPCADDLIKRVNDELYNKNHQA